MTVNFENEFSKLNLGKIVEAFPVRTVPTKKSAQSVAQAVFEKHTSGITDYIAVLEDQKTNCYIARNKNTYSNFQIKSTKKNETYVVDGGFSENNDSRVEVVFNGQVFRLKDDTDIMDINSVRYQIRKDKKASAFIDNFIFTDEKARKKYAIYEKKQQYMEEKNKTRMSKLQIGKKSYS